MMEIEAKFSIANRATFERLSRLETLNGYRVEPVKVKQVDDRYLDTADRAILRAGYACRVRRQGGSQVATLKGLGGADADTGVHRRAEHEVPVEGDDPTIWPDGTARELVLELSGGRPLQELFSLHQRRDVRLLYEDARPVAELSLDAVTFGPDKDGLPTCYELEIELLDDGETSDLQQLAQTLKTTWDLQPEPRSKFERGLALADEAGSGGEKEEPMEESLTADERAMLQTWIEVGNAPQQRRAQIVLGHEEGYNAADIAGVVGLSQRQVRHWLSAFQKQRMGIFPVLPELAPPEEPRAPVTGDASVDSVDAKDLGEMEAPEPPADVSVERLCARNNVDTDRAAHVKDLALKLFDLTADVHQLPPERQTLLSAAAMLHNLGLELDPPRRHLVGRDLILAQPLAGFDRTGRNMLACIVAFHRKKVRRRREKTFSKLSPDLQQETLALAALLRMAVALDASDTQATKISRAEIQGRRTTLIVEGPAAEKDAAVAKRRANLWHDLFVTSLRFMTEAQLAQVPVTVEFDAEMEPLALPELELPGLLPDDPMSEAGRKTLWFHFVRMLKHEPGTRAGEDIEELHDMRVATRRMRAAVRVFGDFFEKQVIKKFNKGIKRVTRALGPVRDLDVFEEKAGHYLATLPPEAQGGLDPLIESWRAERTTARERMLAFLDSDDYRAFKRDFAEFLQTPGAGALSISPGRPVPYQVRHVAPRLIYTRYETVRAYETVLDGAQIETLHALRIDCKYLRYTLEFLREVMGPEGEQVIKEVKAMQDHLGDLNDAEVAIGLLSEFLAEWDQTQTDVPLSQRRSAEGIVTYLASRHAEKHRLVTTFPQAWARLNRQEVRHSLALAVAAL